MKIKNKNAKVKNFSLVVLALFVVLTAATGIADAQTTAFTYQGRLSDNNQAANGNFDFRFQLYNTALNFPTGSPVFVSGVVVTNGAFTVSLDFSGSVQFRQTPNNKLSLEIAVRPSGSSAAYTTLAPRQPVNAVPFAIAAISANEATTAQTASYAGVANLATDSNKLGGLAATDFVRNATNPQSATNFNISGNGTIGGLLIADRIVLTTLGAAGSTSLCLNANNQISSCTPGNFAENSETVNPLRAENWRVIEQLKHQQIVIDELKQTICLVKPDAAVCKQEEK